MGSFLRAVAALGLAAVPVAAQAPLPFWPQGGLPGRDLVSTNFFDHDPNPGSTRTHRCDRTAADGHTGTDALIRSFAEQDLGVPVFAIQDGTVCALDDTHYDRCYRCPPQQPGCRPPGACTICTSNHVHLVHAGGLLTMARHLRRGSVPAGLRVGSCVRAGEEIGRTGSSGASTWPHLHLEVKVKGVSVDPFAGPCNPRPGMWGKGNPAFSAATRLFDLGVTATDPRRIQPPNARPGGGWVAATATEMFVWGTALFVPGRDRRPVPLALTLRDSRGRVAATRTATIEAGVLVPFAERIDLRGVPLSPGSWSLELGLGTPPRTLVVAPFEVTSGSPPPNRPPARPVALAFDPPTPTPSDAIFCRLSVASVEDPDYDRVRYRYVWRDLGSGSVLRDVVHAGRADAIPRRPAGSRIQCCVTAHDGRGGAAAPLCRTVTIGAGSLPPCRPLPFEPCNGRCGPGLPAGWRNLGHAKEGSRGIARLRADRSLAAGQRVRLLVERGRPGAPAVWLLSTGRADLPILGGVLVPAPPVTALAGTLDGHGQGVLRILVPTPVPPASDVYFQTWFADPRASYGLAATNGLVGTTQ